MNFSKSIAASARRKILASQYLRNILLQTFGNTAAQVLGIAFMPLLTRLYTPSDFAALNLFSQAVAGLAILMTLRLEYLVMQPARQSESDRVLRVTFFLGALHVLWLTPVLVFLPGQLAWLRSQGAIADWIWLGPITAWAVSVAVALQQAIQRREDFGASAASEFVGRGAYVACAMLGALSLPSIAGLMTCTLANAGAKLAWLVRVSPDLARNLLHSGDARISKSIRRMAGSTSASNLISLFSGMAPMIYIVDSFGPNALGQYGLVVSTLYLPSTMLGQAIGQVYYQRACRLHGEGDSFTELFIITSSSLAKIGVPLYCAISLLSGWAYPFVFGADWQSAGHLATAFATAAGFSFVASPLDRTCLVVGAWWYVPLWHGLRATTTLWVILMSMQHNLDLENFAWLLAAQMCLMYLIDWLANFWFSLGKK